MRNQTLAYVTLVLWFDPRAGLREQLEGKEQSEDD